MQSGLLRREFLTACAAATVATAATPARPNIVFILADDLGYGDLGCYGQGEILTPHIDKLAAGGLKFTEAYAGSTVCAPSRCALMSGKHTGHCTVRGNIKPEVGLQPKEPILPELLKAAGYRTALFGKWGLGGAGTLSQPNAKGFDEFYGFLDQQYAHNSFPDTQWENTAEVFLIKNWFGRRGSFVQDLYTQKAIDFIKRPSPQPFFLYLAYTSPHADNERGAAEPNGIDVPSNQPYESKPWPEVERSYAALVTRLDRDTGAVLKAIHDAGLESNTLVVFTSDNGPHSEGHHNPEFFHSSGPLRGIKRDLYEGGIRVPFIASWPGRIAPGTTPQVTAFWDMLPTLCEIAGIPPSPAIDGISIAGALLNNTAVPHPPLYWEFHERGFLQAVRDGDWKAVRKKPGPPSELFNLKADSGEKNNLAASEPQLVSKFDRLLTALHTDSKAFPISYKKPRSEEP